MKTLLLCLVVLVACVALASARDLSVSMSVVPNTPRLVVRFNLTNPLADSPATFLKYGTPLEEALYGPIFEVTDLEGNVVPYVGKIARRRFPPLPTAFVRLRPLESAVAEVDLTEEYAFAGAGEYRIRFVGVPQYDDQSMGISASAEVVGRLPIVNRRAFVEAPQANCKPAEDTQIKAAVAGAITESLNAYNCLFRRTCNTLSTRWFGTYNAVRLTAPRDSRASLDGETLENRTRS